MVHLSLRLISDPPGCGFPGNSCFGDGYSAFNISPTPLCLWVQVFVWEEDQIEENGHIGWTGSNIWTSNVMKQCSMIWFMIHYIMVWRALLVEEPLTMLYRDLGWIYIYHAILFWIGRNIMASYEACIMSTYNFAVFCSDLFILGKYNTQLECTQVLLRWK